jgi:hypothetical protein
VNQPVIAVPGSRYSRSSISALLLAMGYSAITAFQSVAATREADNTITMMGATNTNNKDNDKKITKTVEVKLDMEVEIDMEVLLKPC